MTRQNSETAEEQEGPPTSRSPVSVVVEPLDPNEKLNHICRRLQAVADRVEAVLVRLEDKLAPPPSQRSKPAPKSGTRALRRPGRKR